ncbi:MAG: hypothetical protein ACPF8Y_08420, partial [Flavobacteriales bacterium]
PDHLSTLDNDGGNAGEMTSRHFILDFRIQDGAWIWVLCERKRLEREPHQHDKATLQATLKRGRMCWRGLLFGKMHLECDRGESKLVSVDAVHVNVSAS